MRSEARIIFVAIHVAKYVSSGHLEKNKCQIFSQTLMEHEWTIISVRRHCTNPESKIKVKVM